MALIAAATLLGIALFELGAAGLINHVVWQRSLKVFLGGGETIWSTVAVLIFMGGLSVGSWWSGRGGGQVCNPLRTFAILEVLLGGANFCVWTVLTADIPEYVFAMQRVADGVGLPLLMMYVIVPSRSLRFPVY